MRYLSLFSGIEAATVAWHPLGWEPVGFAEIEPFPCAVLAHHYPDVPNLGSVTEITDERIAALGHIDVVVGGSPCQDLSVAGKRNGLAGERSSLFHEQIRIFNAARHFCGARWLIWENVPGAFSSNRGRDFAVVVGAMAGCRIDVPADDWGTEGMALGDAGLVEWCVLDAQWFGVAQRRRRVFAVLDTGNWADRPPILLERDSLRGDSPPSRESREDLAPCLSAHSKGGGGLGTDFDLDGGLIAAKSPPPQFIGSVAMCLNAGAMGRQDAESETLIPTIGGVFDVGITLLSGGHSNNSLDENIVPVPFDTTQITSADNGSNPQPGDPCHPLTAGAHPPAIVFQCHGGNVGEMGTLRATGNVQSGVPFTLSIHGTQDPITQIEKAHTIGRNQGQENAVVTPVVFQPRHYSDRERMGGEPSEICHTLSAASGHGDSSPHVATGTHVRRLTPRECERLQGFPDGYTSIPWRGKLADKCPDGPRYKALGNSMATPVMRWIGERIEAAAPCPNTETLMSPTPFELQ